MATNQISASLFGVVPEDFCRDAPPASAAAIHHTGQQRNGGGPDNSTTGIGLNSTATIANERQRHAPASPAAGGDSKSPRSPPRLRQRLQQPQQQQSPKPWRQRGPPTAATSAGDEEGGRERNREERSRRRLAAFLEGHGVVTGAPAPVPSTAVDGGIGSFVKSPRSPGLGEFGSASDACGGMGDGIIR